MIEPVPMSRRRLLAAAGGLTLFPRRAFASLLRGAEYDVRHFGAVGDGTANDTAALQHAIDSAAAHGGGRVLVPGGRRYLTGSLRLQSGVELHLADDAVLVASTDRQDYAAEGAAILMADGTEHLRITGTGHIDGQGMKFMTTYSETDQRWEPMRFRPYMFSLRRCTDLEISGISFGHSPNWGLHMLGCERVLVDGIRIRNYMDVPNCDGIDPDRCRHVEIRNCDIVGADDAIVIKTSDQHEDFGTSHDIVVRDCVVTSRDSGLKVGTETFGDISKVRFERCKVLSGGRGPTITHRQPGNIEDIEFNDIDVTAEHHAARWWGWGEAASVTAWPRTATGHVGSLRDVRLRNIRARSENSFRIDGQPGHLFEDVLLEHCAVTIDRWTQFPGEHFDNRPTRPDVEGLEPHGTPAFCLRHVRNAEVRDCSASWGANRQPSFSYALEASDTPGLRLERFQGLAAFPDRLSATLIREEMIRE